MRTRIHKCVLMMTVRGDYYISGRIQDRELPMTTSTCQVKDLSDEVNTPGILKTYVYEHPIRM